MKSADFTSHKTRYRAAIRKVLAEAEPGRLDEAGFPAYSHSNPFINWLFWQRHNIVMNYLLRDAPYDLVLDFGCGSGVMLPVLSEISQRVVAMDIDLTPLERVRVHIPLAENIEVRDATRDQITDLPEGTFDLVIALDVLEHVDDLDLTLSKLINLLRPGGEIIISGPTENIFYHIGRKVAGPEYSGDYHKRGVAEIRRALAKQATVRTLATLYWPAPLFEIFAATV